MIGVSPATVGGSTLEFNSIELGRYWRRLAEYSWATNRRRQTPEYEPVRYSYASKCVPPTVGGSSASEVWTGLNSVCYLTQMSSRAQIPSVIWLKMSSRAQIPSVIWLKMSSRAQIPWRYLPDMASRAQIPYLSASCRLHYCLKGIYKRQNSRVASFLPFLMSVHVTSTPIGPRCRQWSTIQSHKSLNFVLIGGCC